MKKIIALFVLIMAFFVPMSPAKAAGKAATEKGWWQRPGLGIAYTVEYRPGWAWNRNFKKYNRTFTDDKGNFIFPGPFCKVDQFVQISKDAGADYHMLYAKWHDGICFFNTKLTHWKSDEDYMAEFSRLSKGEGIPFTIYYSSIFDHNPLFDSIQPFPYSTLSYIQHPKYLDYMKKQYHELVRQYQPDGIWLDWYTDNIFENATVRTTVDFFRNNYPDVILTFNMSSKYKSAYNILSHTTEEIHSLGDPEPDVSGIINSEFFSAFAAPVFYTAFGGTKGWETANKSRRTFNHHWSIVSPVGVFWQDPRLRADTYHLPRIVATVMACGGHITIQANLDIDGYVMEDHVRQIELIGEWYKPRKHLFNNAAAIKYAGESAPGISGLPEGYSTIASQVGGDVLIHVIKREGSLIPSSIAISETHWAGVKAVYLEPEHYPLEISKIGNTILVNLEGKIDPVDTILRLVF